MREFFKNIFFVFFVFVCVQTTKAQLVINELSQGTGGAKEYVEFLVTGTPNCTSECVDLRGWIFDDNNGAFGTTGIASGCYRFKNIAFWQCVKIGTLIVVYNSDDKDGSIPADDLLLTDGNCKLVIPSSNTSLLEKNENNPVAGTPSYASLSFGNTGAWGPELGMANGGDSFQTRNPASLATAHHAVSYGDNTSNSIVFISTSGNNTTYAMLNTTNDNIFTSANWSALVSTTAGSRTPGAPNNAANAAWINTLSNTCTVFSGTAINSVTIYANPNGAYCDGQAIDLLSTISPTSATVTYEWFKNNVTTSTLISSLSINATSTATTYTLKVTDLCSNIITSNNLVIVSSGPITSATINYTPVCTGSVTTLTATTTPNNMSGLIYSWKKNGTAVSISSTLVTTITSTTTTYTLSVIDACGNAATYSRVLFETTPDPSFLPNGGLICKTAATLVLTATSNGGTWSVSPNTSAFNTATGTFNLNTLNYGTYTVSYEFPAPCSAIATKTFDFKEKPVATISSDAGPFCVGSTVRLTANSATANNGTYTYKWLPTNSVASFIDVTTTSTHTLTVTNVCGSTTSNVSSLVFISNPPNFIPNSAILCETDNIITFTTTTNGGSFAISPATNAFDAASKTFNPALTSKNSPYKISYSFAGACPATEVKTFTVETDATAAITISKEGPYCNSEKVKLYSASKIKNRWSTGDTTNYIEVNASGIYSLTVRGCGSRITNAEVELLFSSVTADFNPNVASGNAPLEVVFTNLSSKNSVKYFWNFGDTITSELENPLHTYLTQGEYLVSLVAKNEVGCVDTAFYKFIKITENNYIYIPNSFTPNADGLNDLFVPKTSTILNYSCLIFNRWGEIVFESNDITQSWDGLNATDAVYVYKIKVTFPDNITNLYHGNVTLLH